MTKASTTVATIPLEGSTKYGEVQKIVSLEDLATLLPEICTEIFTQIGSQQTEATYQRCLKMDLEEAGVKVLTEPEILLTYKGKIVGSRRPDLILTTTSGEKAVLELKAVEIMLNEHMKQLHFYMEHTSIQRGYLINFPHDSGFSSVEGRSTFTASRLCGLFEKVSHLLTIGPRTRLKNAPGKREVEVIEVTRHSAARRMTMTKATETKPQGVFGVTAKNEWCKVCINQKDYCWMHRNQRP